jgi:hypothetical protein
VFRRLVGAGGFSGLAKARIVDAASGEGARTQWTERQTIERRRHDGRAIWRRDGTLYDAGWATHLRFDWR